MNVGLLDRQFRVVSGPSVNQKAAAPQGFLSLVRYTRHSGLGQLKATATAMADKRPCPRIGGCLNREGDRPFDADKAIDTALG